MAQVLLIDEATHRFKIQQRIPLSLLDRSNPLEGSTRDEIKDR